MKVDWQAYHDQSLDSADMALHKELLETDPVAHEDYRSFVAFLDKVGSTRAHVDIPVPSLTRRLAQPRGRRRLWPLLAGFGFAAAAGAAWWTLRPLPVQFETGTSASVIFSDDPTRQAGFVEANTGLKVGKMRAPEGDRMWLTKCGAEWSRYDLRGNSGTYSIHIRAADSLTRRFGVTSQTPKPVGQGWGWVSHGLAFYVSGDSAELKAKAESFARQTDNWH